MKKWMTAALLVLFAATAFAQKNQGTVFEKGTLKELLALADEQDKYLFVDVYATWCGPCQMMHPVIDRFQEKMNGRVDVYKVDIDDRDMLEIVHRYNIMSVPTLMFFRRGEVLWRESGRIGYDHLANVLRELEQREQVGQR